MSLPSKKTSIVASRIPLFYFWQINNTFLMQLVKKWISISLAALRPPSSCPSSFLLPVCGPWMPVHWLHAKERTFNKKSIVVTGTYSLCFCLLAGCIHIKTWERGPKLKNLSQHVVSAEMIVGTRAKHLGKVFVIKQSYAKWFLATLENQWNQFSCTSNPAAAPPAQTLSSLKEGLLPQLP